ncbi:hypothetical protein DFH08DRAFT_1080289 [Mycena albidolilacea]|uniref:DUF6533 domain-containing protein n=1 Tax=Mycena albidolilacea TaxID=1033008 RepID=A0AAD7A1K6_9AGAR|nr:hypothetical protein DFH08DRAFT_1080289 [Mycena albidolilacea]
MASQPELLQLVADSRLTGYLAAAALCVLIYDHIECFAEEVQLMWKSRWGVAKIIYLWNRYFSLVVVSLNTSVILQDISSSHVCIGWLQVQGSSSTVLVATVDFVLMQRVWILYGRPRWMVWFFSFLAVSEVVVMIIVDVFAFRQMRDYVHLGEIIKGCYAYNVPKFLTFYAAAPLLVTFIMFAMTLYKCVLTLYHADHRVMPVWRLFLRDGIVWFVLVFAAAGSEVLIWTMRRETLKQLLVVPALVVYSGVSSRTLLNIKRIMACESAEIEIMDSAPISFATTTV